MLDQLDVVCAGLFVRPGDVVLDIGARHGESAALYLGRGAAEVHAFEPLASNRRQIPARVTNDPRFHLHPVVLSDRDGVQEFIVPAHNDGAGSLHRHYFERIRRSEDDGGDIHSVEARRLDGLELPRAAFWKIDCEGAELEVLRGAAGTLGTSPPDIVQIEIFLHEPRRYQDTLNAMARVFPNIWALGVSERGRLVQYDVTNEVIHDREFHANLRRAGTPHYFASTRTFRELVQDRDAGTRG